MPVRRLAGLLIAGAVVGKVLGFVREVAMAQMLGVSIVADSFRGAVTAVLLPLGLLQGDTVPAVLIPLHREWRAEGRAPEQFSALTAALILIALTITALVECFAGPWVALLVGGFSPDALALTRQFVRVMALAMPASVLFNCLISIELSIGRARLTSLRASVQNVGIMLGIIIMVATGKPIAIAWGFTVAFTATVTWGTWMLVREGELRPRSIRAGAAARTLAAFLHRLRAMVAQPLAEQGQIWLERIMASTATSGTVAALDYARNLTDSALYIVSQPIGLAVLADNAGRDREDARRRVARIARPLLMLAMPASAFLVLFAGDIVQVILVRGAFGAKGAYLTSHALAGIGIGLWAATLGLILVRQLNSERRNGVAALVLVTAYAVNVILNVLLTAPLGAFGIGLGEAARGITMLTGAALALRSGRTILLLIMQVLPSCAVLWLASTAAHAWMETPLLRVGLGTLAYVAVVGATGAMLAPSLCRMVAVRIAAKAGWRHGAMAEGQP